MIFVLILGGVLGWVVHRAHAQRDAVAAIRAARGHVTYDWQLKRLPSGDTQFDPTAQPWAPSRLFDALGPDYFGHVENVALNSRQIDAVMKHVGQLDKLRAIRITTKLDLTPVARAGLESLPNIGPSRFKGLFGLIATDLSPPPFNGTNFKYLKNLTRLEYLELPADSAITDADLACLSKLTALRRLELHDPRITDAGLVSLKDMTRLDSLSLARTQVKGAGLANLRAMNGLKILNLSRTHVDDLAPLGQLTVLAHLFLSRTPIDDRGLAPIAGLTGLEMVRLDGTNVSGACYSYLKHLTKLTHVSLQKTNVRDEGSAALSEMKALILLDLDGTRISDVTLTRLAVLPALQELSVARTQITDHGLAKLVECKALRRLNVSGTKISREGLNAFQIARPNLRVVR
jgi:hypothetical protein